MRSRSRDGSSCARGTARSACRWTLAATSIADGSRSAARRSAVSIPRSHRAGTAGGASRPRRTCSTTLCSPTSSRTASPSSALRRRTDSSMSAPTRRSRSSSRTTDVLYITAGDPRRRTGGNIYARLMIAALRRDGIGARTLALDARSARSLRDQRARVAIVDTIATNLAAPRLRALRTRGTRVIALVLMSQGAQVLARRADRTVVPSITLARELVAAGISRASISVIAPGKDASAPSSSKSAGRVLCVANWSPAKGIHTLVSAIASVPGATLDLVGDADGPYAARVRRLLVRHGLASRVRVHGNLGGAALERRYRSASAFVLPSVRESYGMALASALAFGLPSIACDIPATREVAWVRSPTPCARSRKTANCATACDRARCAAHARSRHGGGARPRSCASCARSLRVEGRGPSYRARRWCATNSSRSAFVMIDT